MTGERREATLLERLRSDFDRSFAAPAHAEQEARVEVLGFRAGGGLYAAHLGQIAAVHPIRAMTRVPGRRPGFEGLIAVQGQLVAVYDLAVLVAAPGGAAARQWLLLCRDDRQVGLAVDVVDGYQRLMTAQLVPSALHHGAEPGASGGAVTHAVAEGEATRLVVDLSAVLAEIRRSVAREGGPPR